MLTVNLTTTPARLFEIDPAIQSIREQSMQPDAINLHVPLACMDVNNAEDWLNHIESVYKLNLCGIPFDYGPASKVISALEHNYSQFAKEGDIIVTADDDVIYPKDWLENLYSAFTGRVALGYRGKILDGSTYKESTCTYAKYTCGVNVITGTWGAMYKAEWFDAEELKKMIVDNAPESYYCDHIVINAYLLSHGIGRWCIATDSEFKPTEAHKINALWDVNKDADYNDKLIKRLGL